MLFCTTNAQWNINHDLVCTEFIETKTLLERGKNFQKYRGIPPT